MSTTIFITTKSIAIKSTVPWMAGKSLFIIAFKANLPTPGHPKMDSVKTAPER